MPNGSKMAMTMAEVIPDFWELYNDWASFRQQLIDKLNEDILQV